ncbi:hypothetical protein C8R44DRAFT_773015 [Mycena epipterygia]|nr:hypothetical protein C8R44DRAFT_773015 [Mycena epipterygia]
MPKRKQMSEDSGEEMDEILEEVGLTPDILKTLQAHPEATKVVAELANRMRIPDTTLKSARRNLPSFSNITWKEVAAYFTLDFSFNVLVFDPIQTVEACFLPPSFHKKNYPHAWSAMDVYAEPTEQVLEASKVRLLDSFLIPIFALFAGRVADLPEKPMPRTALSSGSSVEHELFIVGNVLFFVIELKKLLDTESYAQLFAELYSAAELNSLAGFRSLTVYGLLTDLGTFEFFSFEPISKTFYRDPKMFLPRIREDVLSAMIEVSNKVFSIVLQGFINTLKATCDKCQIRSTAGSLSPTGSSPIQQLQQTPSNPPPATKAKGRPSLRVWERARDDAMAAQAQLKRFSDDLTTLETTTKEGLKLLEKSVARVVRMSESSSRYDLPSEARLEKLAQNAVVVWHAKHMAIDADMAIDTDSELASEDSTEK